jgi:plasmid stability protein
MALSLSIKSVPNELVEELRKQAARNHRSIQGELLHILEAAVRPRPFRAEALRLQLEALGVSTPGESVTMVREDRDERGG